MCPRAVNAPSCLWPHASQQLRTTPQHETVSQSMSADIVHAEHVTELCGLGYTTRSAAADARDWVIKTVSNLCQASTSCCSTGLYMPGCYDKYGNMQAIHKL